MKLIIATLQLFLVLTLVSCATHFNEPDPTKVVESTKKVREGISKARDNSKKVTESIKTAQDTSDHLTLLSHGLMGKIDELLGIISAEWKPPLLLIKADVIDLQTNITILDTALGEAFKIQTVQDSTLADVTLRESELEKNQLEYRNDAQKLADTTTKLSAKVAWYQWHWWGSWIAFGIGILICLAFAILKVMGKLSFL